MTKIHLLIFICLLFSLEKSRAGDFHILIKPIDKFVSNSSENKNNNIFGMNDSANIIGRVGVTLDKHKTVEAFLSENGQMRYLGILPIYSENGWSSANAINNKGEIVGCSGNDDDYGNDENAHAFIYKKGNMQDLGTLGGNYSSAQSINDTGDIAGISKTGAGETHAFLYHNGKLIDISNITEFKYYSVNAMNNNSAIIGTMSLTPYSFKSHAYLYKDGKIKDVSFSGDNNFVPNSINDHGVIVGDIFLTSQKIKHAAIYQNGVITDLTSLYGFLDKQSSAISINNSGDILINIQIDRNKSKAVIVNKENHTIFLDDLIKSNSEYSIDYAVQINNNRQIVCVGRTPNGEGGFVMTIINSDNKNDK